MKRYKHYLSQIILFYGCYLSSNAWAVHTYTIQAIQAGISFENLINDQGEIVGTERAKNELGDDVGQRTILWHRGVLTTITNPKNGFEDTTCSWPTAINNSGDIVFVAGNPQSSALSVFLWRKGTIISLGLTLWPADYYPSSCANSIPYAIHKPALNEKGQIVASGMVKDSLGNLKTHAFLWHEGNLIDLDPAPASAEYTGSSYPIDLNDTGEVLLASGVNYPPFINAQTGEIINYGSERPLVWTQGVYKQLASAYSKDGSINVNPTSVSFGQAWGINNNGIVVGTMVTKPCRSCDTRPVDMLFWQRDGSIKRLTYDGYRRDSSFVKLNNANQVVGIYNSSYNVTFNDPVSMVSLDGLTFNSILPPSKRLDIELQCSSGNYATIDINDQGQFAGSYTCPSFATNTSIYRAFVQQDDVLLGLNDLIPPTAGWIIIEVKAINNAGQILVKGNKGYALLTPATGLQASCDANKDGSVNQKDLAIIHSNKSTNNSAYDVNGDGLVTISDLRICITRCNTSHCKN